jgi:hypothetical protein
VVERILVVAAAALVPSKGVPFRVVTLCGVVTRGERG